MEYNQKKLTERLFCTPETHTILQIRYTPIIILKRMSVSQFSHSFMSNSLWPQGLQHSRLCCPSPTPGAYSNSCPWSQWCYPPISSSVVPFSSCLQSFPAPGSLLMSQFFTSGSQRIGVSALASVLPMNIPDWFPLGLTSWNSLQSKELSRVFSNTTPQFKIISSLALSFLYGPTLRTIHDYWKSHSFDYMDLCWRKDAFAS